MTPANRARMREVISRAVRTGLFPGGVGPHAAGHAHDHDHGGEPGHLTHAGTNDAGVDTLPTAAIAGTASVAPPTDGLPRRERFRAALDALAGVIHEARSIDEAADVVAAIAARLDCKELLAWSDEAMDLPGMTAALQARGLTTVDAELPQAEPARAPRLAALAQLTLGLTGADAGLADTGSVVVASGPGRSRMASLLVPVHIAVLRVDRLVDSISGLLATRGDLVAAGSNLVAITGPSRTADIEHTLSRGVHGPGEVHVILFDA
ncbi:MAG: lactate utilization protein [Vicinamibacteraceae bacterium]